MVKDICGKIHVCDHEGRQICYHGDEYQLKINVSRSLQAAMSLDVCRCAPEPQYTILREPVEGELPEFLIMEVQLPGIVSPLLFLPSFLLAAVV